MARKRITAPPKGRNLAALPEGTPIRTHEVASMTGYQREYIRKKAKADPDFPQPLGRTGTGPRGPLWFDVSVVRKYVAGRGKPAKK